MLFLLGSCSTVLDGMMVRDACRMWDQLQATLLVLARIENWKRSYCIFVVVVCASQMTRPIFKILWWKRNDSEWRLKNNWLCVVDRYRPSRSSNTIMHTTVFIFDTVWCVQCTAVVECPSCFRSTSTRALISRLPRTYRTYSILSRVQAIRYCTEW